jgi:hypothetical protein
LTNYWFANVSVMPRNFDRAAVAAPAREHVESSKPSRLPAERPRGRRPAHGRHRPESTSTSASTAILDEDRAPGCADILDDVPELRRAVAHRVDLTADRIDGCWHRRSPPVVDVVTRNGTSFVVIDTGTNDDLMSTGVGIC